jgi:hypothetical protein
MPSFWPLYHKVRRWSVRLEEVETWNLYHRYHMAYLPARVFLVFNICYLNVCVQEVLCSIYIVDESCTFFAASLLPLPLPLLSYITPFLPSVALSPTTIILLRTFLHNNNKLFVASTCFLFFLNSPLHHQTPFLQNLNLLIPFHSKSAGCLRSNPYQMSATESSRSSGQTSKELRYSRENLLSLRDQLPVIICDVTKMNNTSAGTCSLWSIPTGHPQIY